MAITRVPLVPPKTGDFSSIRTARVRRSRSGSSTVTSITDAESPYGRVGNSDVGRDFRELFGLRPDNVFMIKVNYWLNP